MPSFCNSTLSSSPDRDECMYWSSFNERPFTCGDRVQVYKGKLNGKGPRGGDFSVVKIFQDGPGTKARCQTELDKCKRACELSEQFASGAGHRTPGLRVAQLQMAPVDQVSLLNRLMSSKRRPVAGEWLLLEEIVSDRHHLYKFVDKLGRRCGTAPHVNWLAQELVEALVHFSFHVSGGAQVMCGLEGGLDEGGRVTLKTPVLHSRQRRYGETDMGPEAIRQVMQHHACNVHCRRFLSLSRASSSPSLLTPSSSSSSLVTSDVPRPLPSAPYDPDLLGGSGLSTRFLSHPCLPEHTLEDATWSQSQMSLDTLPPSPSHDTYLVFRLELDKPLPIDPPPPYSENSDDYRIISPPPCYSLSCRQLWR